MKTCHPRISLDRASKRTMLELMQEHYHGVTPERFEQDLEGKDWVVLLRDASGICGFTTLVLNRLTVDGRNIRVLYSGDTIMAERARGSSRLARAWIDAVEELRAQSSLPLFWLLITSGFRTYRFLPVFWREFFPRFDRETPPEMRQLLQTAAAAQYRERWDPDLGIVRLDTPQPLRRPDQLPSGRLQDSHIRFFLERNPGHHLGDELVSICELAPGNLTPAGRRMLRGETARHAPSRVAA